MADPTGAMGADDGSTSTVDLAALCKRGAANSVGAVGDLRKMQEKLMGLYFESADAKVPEGRSNVVSKDVFEVVEWTTPDLMEVLSGGNIVTFCAAGPEDEDYVGQVEDAVQDVIWRECAGFRLITSFVKDGLMQYLGVMLVDWLDKTPGPIERFEGLNDEQMLKLFEAEDQGILEIKEANEHEAKVPEAQAGESLYDVGYRRIKQGRVILQSIRPGNFRFTAGAEHIDQSQFDGPPYVGATIPGVSLSELKRMFPDANLENLTESGDKLARIDTIVHGSDNRADADRKTFSLEVEFVRADMDGDGYEELQRVWRVGDRILKHYEVANNLFAVWTPILVPGRVAGLTPADAAADIQVIQTALLRNGIDSARDSSSPIAAVRDGLVNLNDLISIQEGRTRAVRVHKDVNPNEAVAFSEQPDRSQSQMAMFDSVLRVRERRTGVSPQNQGLDPKMLDGTATGASILDRRGMQLRAMQLRQAAQGYADICAQVMRVLIEHQQQPRAFKLRNKKWRPLNPSTWNPDMTVSVHVGISGASQPERVALVSNIMGVQEKMFGALGPDNPVVTPQHLVESAHELVRVAGYRDPSKFFAEVPPGWKPTPPQDPRAAAEAAKVQAKQAEIAQNGELRREEMASDAQIKREEIDATIDAKRYQIDAEVQLKRDTVLIDAATGANSPDVNVGGDPG